VEKFKTQFGQLGGFAGTGFACNDDNLMGGDQLFQLIEAAADRQ
jgi:hypothetical protein